MLNVKEFRPRLTRDEFEHVLNYKKRKLDRDYKKFFIMPDAHVPAHNKELIDKVLELIHAIQPDGFISPGDFLDLKSLSNYDARSLASLKDITLEDEYAAGRQLITEITQALPSHAEKHYIYGNHEDRYFREVKKEDNAKYGGALMSPDEGLSLTKEGWKVYTNWTDDFVLLGEHLQVLHGFFTNIHTANKHLETYGSCVFGHTHRFQTIVKGHRAAYNIGWMGDKNHPYFKYMPRVLRDSWCNGFAFANIDSTGRFWVEPIQCFDNKFFYNLLY